jgi:hypothetical protein
MQLQVQSPQRDQQPELWRMHLFHNITTAMTVMTAVLRAKMTTSVLILIPFKRMDAMSKNRHLWHLSRQQLQKGRLWIPRYPHHPVYVTHFFKKS